MRICRPLILTAVKQFGLFGVQYSASINPVCINNKGEVVKMSLSDIKFTLNVLIDLLFETIQVVTAPKLVVFCR